MTSAADVRADLQTQLDSMREELVEFCTELGRNQSQNPPGDTSGMVAACRRALEGLPGVTLEDLVSEPPKVNLVVRLKGGKPGRRLVMNGHLDTGPVPDLEKWTVPPFGGLARDGRLYGRGIADMKGGVAANVFALRALSKFRDWLGGELALMLVGDEGTGGKHGTQYVLKLKPDLAGDAMLSGDVGSSHVVRIGEKGFIFIEVEAYGRSAPGAQPHRGDNAILRLILALQALMSLEKAEPPIPPAMKVAIDKAGEISEAVNGAGETHMLTHTTVNIGLIQGGVRINNVPSKASARIDIRIPPGLSVATIRNQISQLLGKFENIQWRELDSAEPNWTAPDEEIVRFVHRNAAAVLGIPVGISIRPGFSDGRFFRQLNVPTVVYGMTPHNGNAPDEYLQIDELVALFKVHALAAFDYLSMVSEYPN
jgi:succinyl-diaminopimelate desuccinylase